MIVLTPECVCRHVLADHWYSLSYLYFSPVGTFVVIVVGLVVSLLTGKYWC